MSPAAGALPASASVCSTNSGLTSGPRSAESEASDSAVSAAPRRPQKLSDGERGEQPREQRTATLLSGRASASGGSVSTVD